MALHIKLLEKGKGCIILFLFLSAVGMAQQNDTIDGQRVLSFSQEMPKFKGDVMKYMMDSMQVLVINDEQVQSHVYVSFIIDTAGNVCKPVISQPVMKGKISKVEEQALNAVKHMPKWTPGYQNGKVVPVRYEIPITIDFR